MKPLGACAFQVEFFDILNFTKRKKNLKPLPGWWTNPPAYDISPLGLVEGGAPCNWAKWKELGTICWPQLPFACKDQIPLQTKCQTKFMLRNKAPNLDPDCPGDPLKLPLSLFWLRFSFSTIICPNSNGEHNKIQKELIYQFSLSTHTVSKRLYRVIKNWAEGWQRAVQKKDLCVIYSPLAASDPFSLSSPFCMVSGGL